MEANNNAEIFADRELRFKCMELGTKYSGDRETAKLFAQDIYKWITIPGSLFTEVKKAVKPTD